ARKTERAVFSSVHVLPFLVISCGRGGRAVFPT
ncbi:hypothetical protein LPJCHP_LPJCHP_16500, partial [Dysosmobacter welbionis]